MMTRSSFCTCAAIAALCGLGGRARADGFDGQRFVPAAGAAGGLMVERPLVPQHLGFGVGTFIGYGYDPVVDRDRPAGVVRYPLHHALSLDILGSIGLGNIFELAVHLPVHAYFAGDPDDFAGAAIRANSGVGDLRLVPKLAWQFGRTDLNFGVGFMLPVSFPTGDDNALRGAGGFQLEPRFLFAFGGRRWNFAFNTGFRWRPGQKQPDFTGGEELTFGVAGTFGLVTGKVGLDLIAELDGGWQPNALGHGTIRVPLEALAALVVKPHREWSVYVGGGAGLDNGLGTPDFRVFAGVRYGHRVPDDDRFKDNDHDGINNLRDQCPDEPEDYDGFQDNDGCPEPDNDHDGILDDDDECPDQAEEPGGDKDGCPEHARVLLRRGKIEIFGKVLFRTGSAEIHKKSQDLLDQIAAVMKSHPEVRRIQVAGHTDNVGGTELNLRLSRERADSVKRALVDRGVDHRRIHTVGYGESRPLVSNGTRAGRAKNRRVEFVVVQR